MNRTGRLGLALAIVASNGVQLAQENMVVQMSMFVLGTVGLTLWVLGDNNGANNNE